MSILLMGTLVYFIKDYDPFLIGAVTVFLATLLLWIIKKETPVQAYQRWQLTRSMRQHLSRRKIRLQKPDPHGPLELLALPTQLDTSFEVRKDSFDSHNFYGVDVKTGSSLSLGIQLLDKSNRHAEVFLQWFDKDSGEFYSLVNDGSVVEIESSGENQIIAAGIHLTIVEPMRKWRILFNGMLRKKSTNEVVHVKLSLLWSAAHSPFDWSTDCSLDPLVQIVKKTNLTDTETICDQLIPNGYDQWGSLIGEAIFFQNQDEKTIYLRGLRKKRFSTKRENKHENFQILGITENGFLFSLQQSALKISSTESKLFNIGLMMIPGRDCFSMVELDVPSFEWHHELVEKNQFAIRQDFMRFQAGGRCFNVGIQMRKEIFKVENQNSQSHLMHADITFNCRRGRALCISRKILSGSHAQVPDVIERFEELALSGEIPMPVVPINSRMCTASSLTGGKASSLALMLTANENLGEKISIPHGVCVTTVGFDVQLKDYPELTKLVDLVAEQSSKLNCAKTSDEKEKEKTALENACKSLEDAFKSTPLSEAVSSSINNNLDKVFGTDDQLSELTWSKKKFAVRSSAVGEDSSDLSSAGQNETFLGCAGPEAIKEAVRKCWASLYAFQSVEYRRQNGQPVKTGMAVVIQEMVAAESAGVLFTRDPMSGDPSKIVITANFGLGESVVSASSDPDTIEIRNKFWEDSLSIESVRIGLKSTRIDMSAESGTSELRVDPEVAGKICISEGLCLRLAKLGILLEKKFGSPRDIEFAVVKDEIYLLQSRPITTLSVMSDFELEHEFDSSTFSDEDIWTKANLGEVIPGATTPLTNSLALNCLDFSLQKMMLDVPYNPQAFSPYVRRILPIAHHHCFFNYLECCLPHIESEEVNAHIKAVDLAVFGHDVTTKAAIQSAIDRRGLGSTLVSKLRLLHMAKTVLKTIYWQKYGLDQKFLNPLFANPEELTIKELYKKIGESATELERVFGVHSQVSEASTVFQLIVFLTLAENGPASSWSTDLFADAANILASDVGDVVSAGCPTELQSLSDTIFECLSETTIENFTSKSTEVAELWLQNEPRVASTYKEFVEKFGHRCLREFEMMSIPWSEDRSPLISTLQAMVAAKAGRSSKDEKKKRVSTEDKLDTLQTQIKPGTKKALKFLLPYAHGAVALRETSKSAIIWRSHQFRMNYRILAQKLCQEGFLPDPDLIFFITHFEIQELIEKRSPSILQRAIRRRRLRSFWDELRFREMNYGPPCPIQSNSNQVFASNAEGLIVAHGTPVCRGKYRGVAKVITRLADAPTIKQGDILITVSTDIGWSPYFPLLGAVATELGGLISHGAVVAREYGLPCVVGVEGATSIFKTGDIVEMDAAKGTITKIPCANEN